jgi:hypothetical protein
MRNSEASYEPLPRKAFGLIEKEEEWILIFEIELDRINRIVRIERPLAEGISLQASKIPSIL